MWGYTCRYDVLLMVGFDPPLLGLISKSNRIEARLRHVSILMMTYMSLVDMWHSVLLMMTYMSLIDTWHSVGHPNMTRHRDVLTLTTNSTLISTIFIHLLLLYLWGYFMLKYAIIEKDMTGTEILAFLYLKMIACGSQSLRPIDCVLITKYLEGILQNGWRMDYWMKQQGT